jgi:hypothetical protein
MTSRAQVAAHHPVSFFILTPTAYFMKGMTLEAADHPEKAIVEFRALIKKYPTSDEAKSAREQLKALGVSVAAPTAAPVRMRPQ